MSIPVDENLTKKKEPTPQNSPLILAQSRLLSACVWQNMIDLILMNL